MDKNIYVKTLEVAGFASAFKAMRLPMKSEEKSDSVLGFLKPEDVNLLDVDIKHLETYCCFGEKDIQLLKKLIKAGDEHAKVLRGVIVWAEMNLPRYIWQEMDTYCVGTDCLGSESTMHCEAKGLSGKELESFKEELKEGHVQKRIRTFSYQTLRRIYFQRRNHRLPIWRETIIPWIESLPLAGELITINPWYIDKINQLENQIEAIV